MDGYLTSSPSVADNDPNARRPFEFSLLDVIVGVLRRKRQVALIVISLTLITTVMGFLVPATFTATTKVMPPQQTQSIASIVAGQLGPLAGLAGRDLGPRNPSELYVSLLGSQSVENALIQRFDLVRVYRTKLLFDARKRLASKSGIVASKEGIISISVSDRDPKRAAEIANGYVDELFKLNQTLAVSEAAQRRLFFAQQLEQEKNELSNAEVALAQSQRESGLIQLDSQAKATIEENARLEAELAAAEVQLGSMSTFATPENPGYVRAQQQAEALRTQLAKSGQKQTPGSLLPGSRAIPQLGLEYIRKVRDEKYHEALYELLMRQYEAAKLDEAKSASIIQVLDKALVPERRSAPRHSVYFLVGLSLGILIALVWVFLAELTVKASSNDELGPKFQEIQEHLRLTRTRESRHSVSTR